MHLDDPTYANVAPDPTMYFPSVLKTPAVPAPYWKMVTVPERQLDDEALVL